MEDDVVIVCNIWERGEMQDFFLTMKYDVEQIKFIWEVGFDHERKEDATSQNVPY